jgi:membrane protease subunit HflC
MQRLSILLLGIAFIVIAFVGLNSLFIVHQTQYALVLRFGEAKRVILTPGLRVKVPMAERVVYLDRRLLPVEMLQQPILASDQKTLVVDAFARYRIHDPVRFYRAFLIGGGTEETATTRLEGYLSAAVRNAVANQPLVTLLSEQRGTIMRQIRDLVNQQVQSDGVQIVDVRIKRADLPEANSQSVYTRMQSERQQAAAGIRAEGKQTQVEIQARADREATVIKAEAQKQGEILRGQGDAERNKIFADAFGQDPEFFDFYRSMKAYETALGKNDTTFVVGTDSAFFHYFEDADAASKH